MGSLGGLLALARGEAHFAGSHLLDEETGEYNVAYIRRLLPDVRIVLLGFVQREQGLIVPRGNPKGIRGLTDLARPDVVFINRQRGAGTRVLLDYRLKGAGIDPRAIQGYDRQEFTHLAVAAAVASGAADCGLGILAAARALDLDFRAAGPRALRPGHPGRVLRERRPRAAAGDRARSGVRRPGRCVGRLRHAADGTRAGRAWGVKEAEGPLRGR